MAHSIEIPSDSSITYSSKSRFESRKTGLAKRRDHDGAPGEEAVVPAPRRRPIGIALVILGPQLRFDLNKLVRRLNGMQTLFNYFLVTPPVHDLGEPDEKHVYSDEVYFSRIEKRISGSQYDLGIGITYERLQQSSFNRHDHMHGYGVVTMADFEKFTPRDKTLDQYLAYLLLCESFCLAGHQHFEHRAQKFCLFDECIELYDLFKCLQRPRICRDICEKRLLNSGFTEHDLLQARLVLDYVGRTSLMQVLDRSINNPVSGFFLGGLLVQLIYAYIANLPAPWLHGITGGLGVAFLLSLGWSYRRAQPRYPR